MRTRKQRDRLVEAIELVLPEMRSGPSLSAYGIAREDCALVHMDHFEGLSMAASHLLDVLGDVTGENSRELCDRLGMQTPPCDCRSCAGDEAHTAAVKKHRESYTLVEKFKEAA